MVPVERGVDLKSTGLFRIQVGPLPSDLGQSNDVEDDDQTSTTPSDHSAGKKGDKIKNSCLKAYLPLIVIVKKSGFSFHMSRVTSCILHNARSKMI